MTSSEIEESKFAQFLKAEHPSRLEYGNRWLFWDEDALKWAVWEQSYGKKPTEVWQTSFIGDALDTLKGLKL